VGRRPEPVLATIFQPGSITLNSSPGRASGSAGWMTPIALAGHGSIRHSSARSRERRSRGLPGWCAWPGSPIHCSPPDARAARGGQDVARVPGESTGPPSDTLSPTHLLAHYGSSKTLAAGGSPSTQPSPAHRRAHRSKTLDGPLSLQELSALADLSVFFHFAGPSRNAPGCLLTGTCCRRRVERAKESSWTPGRAWRRFALRCGFSHQSHFTRAFHQLSGMTPTCCGASARPSRALSSLRSRHPVSPSSFSRMAARSPRRGAVLPAPARRPASPRRSRRSGQQIPSRRSHRTARPSPEGPPTGTGRAVSLSAWLAHCTLARDQLPLVPLEHPKANEDVLAQPVLLEPSLAPGSERRALRFAPDSRDR
jgi:AraC-like DNA-binding protein